MAEPPDIPRTVEHPRGGVHAEKSHIGVAEKGLRSDAIGLVGSVVIGIASTAPAYSLAATLGFVAIAVGLQAPAIMVLAFVPIYCIAVAYAELNKAEPDCGTTFTWATRAFGPRTGWMGGWGIIITDVIVMANLAQIAGKYMFLLVGADGLAESTFWVTLAGVAWIVVMTWICYIGIEVSARMQFWLLALEVVILVVFAVYALYRVYNGSAPEGSITPTWSWLNPFEIDSVSAFSEALLLAVFIYWGWDTAVAVNEETADRETTPGRAAIISTFLLLATYAVVTVATQAYAGIGEEGIGLSNEANADDVIAVVGESVFEPLGGLGQFLVGALFLLVLTSAAASTQTTILPTARGTLSMAVYKAIPSAFARIHPRYLTPTVSTWAMGLVSVLFYVALTIVSEDVLADSVASIGLMIAFYYGLTGFATPWYFGRYALNSPRNLLRRTIIPLAGGVMLLGAFLKSAYDYADPEYGSTSFTILGWHVGGVFVMGIGGLLLGVVLMELYRIKHPSFFRGEVIGPWTPIPVLREPDLAAVGLPDSGFKEPLVVPPGSEIEHVVEDALGEDAVTHDLPPELPHDRDGFILGTGVTGDIPAIADEDDAPRG